MAREFVVVYRWSSEHNHVEKGRRFSDGRVLITAPPVSAESHALATPPSTTGADDG